MPSYLYFRIAQDIAATAPELRGDLLILLPRLLGAYERGAGQFSRPRLASDLGLTPAQVESIYWRLADFKAALDRADGDLLRRGR